MKKKIGITLVMALALITGSHQIHAQNPQYLSGSHIYVSLLGVGTPVAGLPTDPNNQNMMAIPLSHFYYRPSEAVTYWGTVTSIGPAGQGFADVAITVSGPNLPPHTFTTNMRVLPEPYTSYFHIDVQAPDVEGPWSVQATVTLTGQYKLTSKAVTQFFTAYYGNPVL